MAREFRLTVAWQFSALICGQQRSSPWHHDVESQHPWTPDIHHQAITAFSTGPRGRNGQALLRFFFLQCPKLPTKRSMACRPSAFGSFSFCTTNPLLYFTRPFSLLFRIDDSTARHLDCTGCAVLAFSFPTRSLLCHEPSAWVGWPVYSSADQPSGWLASQFLGLMRRSRHWDTAMMRFLLAALDKKKFKSLWHQRWLLWDQ
ncbi:hypothetical protein IWX91DRAFT_346696 [Phyllosticta citricarpa]